MYPTGGPCVPVPEPWRTRWLTPSLVTARVIVIVIVAVFALALLIRGYDLQAALVGAGVAVLGAAEIARRVVDGTT